ncbi:MAG: DNA polymerase III subunit delta [Planctomycetes bacterium]|nr:DNA polymerase III subunit delta [Planctomycetota bacterium]
MHATQFLKAPDKHDPWPMTVLHGSERHLQQAAFRAVAARLLGGEVDELGLARFAGKEVDLATVLDELATISMWGGKRLVAIEDADDFVTAHRAALEKYIEKPAKRSTLLLTLRKWPKTTRLAKAVAKSGLDVECSELKGVALTNWLCGEARDTYGCKLQREAAALLVELAGTTLALLDQELAKLASYAGERREIGIDDVRTLVGGWRAETTWAMIDELLDARLPQALAHLDRLLSAGESPHMVLGGMVFKFRQLAEATERARQTGSLPAALRDAGVWGNRIDATNRYLRRIGRPRAERIYDRLTEADARLKGEGRLPERVVLERLLVELSGGS